jgi:hypothetical protein
MSDNLDVAYCIPIRVHRNPIFHADAGVPVLAGLPAVAAFLLLLVFLRCCFLAVAGASTVALLASLLILAYFL